MIDDRALVRKILEGDTQAFRLLMSQHQRLVAHMIRRLIKVEEECEELCQDVFLKVHEKIGQVLVSIQAVYVDSNNCLPARNKSSAEEKRCFSPKCRKRVISTRHLWRGKTRRSLMTEKDMDEFVFRLIDELPPQYKSVLTLYHVENMTYPEICEVMSMPEGTVKNYLFRARNLLKEKVKKYLGKEELL